MLRGTFYDIGERKQLEARLLAVNETLEARVGELREEARALEVLNRTGIAVGAELDLERLVQIVTDAGVELSGAEFGAFFYNVIKAGRRSLHALYAFRRAARGVRQFSRCRAIRQCSNRRSAGRAPFALPTSWPIRAMARANPTTECRRATCRSQLPRRAGAVAQRRGSGRLCSSVIPSRACSRDRAERICWSGLRRRQRSRSTMRAFYQTSMRGDRRAEGSRSKICRS